MNKKNNVADYYSRFGSWAGYNLVLGRSQHAGYWLDDTKNERQAQDNYMQEVAKKLNLKSGEKALDAGSGQGYAARYLAELTRAEITGITITPREVKISEKLSQHIKNRPTFILGDYAATNFSDNHFDVIYTTETLVHAKDMQATMNEFYRILKPSVRVVFFDYEVLTDESTPALSSLAKFLYDYAGGYGIYQQNPGQIANFLQKAGFMDVVETDWSKYTKPTYDRLRRIAKPLSWIEPSSRLAPHFINAVMASHGYSNMYESGNFRYIVYSAVKPR